MKGKIIKLLVLEPLPNWVNRKRNPGLLQCIMILPHMILPVLKLLKSPLFAVWDFRGHSSV